MKFYISAANYRHEIEQYELDNLYDENILYMDRYNFTGDINIYASKDFDEDIQDIGLIQATFLDEKMISDEDAGSLARIADAIDVDISRAFEYLIHSDIYKALLCAEHNQLPLHSCYISHFWISPDYRSQGLGTHLLENLDRIYQHMFNTYINCMVVYPKPSSKKEGWKDAEEEIQARKRMIRFFKINGFIALGDSGFYARNYASD